MIGVKCGISVCVLASTLGLVTPARADDVSAADTAPWMPLGRLTGGAVRSIVFDTAHPGVAFAGSDAALIYRSKDGGASWRPVSVGTVVEGFRALAISPTKPGTVYAYSSDNFQGGQGTLYRSVDHGLSWAPLRHQPSSAVTGSYYAGVGRGIAIDPTGTILVLTDAVSGVLRSSDGGETWTNPVSDAATYGLAVSPTQRGVLWVAGLDYASGLPSIWKSADFGASWTVQTPAAFNPPGAGGARAYAIT
ncbi:MAG: WD40/YVTN/BNR-like repeat-containing protein, partial [Terriglobia bacterium]